MSGPDFESMIAWYRGVLGGGFVGFCYLHDSTSKNLKNRFQIRGRTFVSK